MSSSTDVILTCSIMEGEAIKRLNYDIAENNNGSSLDNLSEHPFGMRIIANALIGSFVGLDIKKLFNSVLKAKWNDPDEVRLMIREDHYSGFRSIDLRGVYYELLWMESEYSKETKEEGAPK